MVLIAAIPNCLAVEPPKRVEANLPSLLPRVEILVVFLSFTPEPGGFLSGALMQHLPRRAHSVNALQEAGDTHAPPQAPKQSKPGAVTVVTDPESLTADHTLWEYIGILLDPPPKDRSMATGGQPG